MTRIIRQIARRLGLVAIPAASWAAFERRFGESEAERQRLIQERAAARAVLDASAFPSRDGDVADRLRAFEAGWMDRAAALAGRLASAEAAWAAADAQAESLGGRFHACQREKELLALAIGRAEARVKALARRRDRLAAERDAARRHLAAGDTSGRIGDLEAENRRLAQRVADLEQYLAETRGEGARAYL